MAKRQERKQPPKKKAATKTPVKPLKAGVVVVTSKRVQVADFDLIKQLMLEVLRQAFLRNQSLLFSQLVQTTNQSLVDNGYNALNELVPNELDLIRITNQMVEDGSIMQIKARFTLPYRMHKEAF